jgi:mono/diheme cytochrome c family protein
MAPFHSTLYRNTGVHMSKSHRILLIAVLLLMAAAIGFSKDLKVTPIVNSNTASGAQMYADYCAACHGADGKSDGRAVAFLKAPPPELSTLALRNGGKYPARRVSSILHARAPKHAEAVLDMPDWWALFRKGPEAELRIRNLTKFVETLQQQSLKSE